MPATPELAAFIRDHFRSVWTLELLLFLKENASSSWPNEALVRALRASDAIVINSLDILFAGGLVLADHDGRAQYDQLVEILAGGRTRAGSGSRRVPAGFSQILESQPFECERGL